MSERDVELHRRWFEAYNARDTEALIAYCDPDIVLHSVFAAAVGGVYHRHDGLRSWHRDMQDVWGNEIRFDPEAYYDLGEHTLVVGVMRGRGKHSGVEVAMPGAQVARWRRGLMVHAKG